MRCGGNQKQWRLIAIKAGLSLGWSVVGVRHLASGLGVSRISKIKHAIKHKASPARLAQLLQPSLAFCFSLQPMTAYRPGLDGTPSLAES